MFCLCSKFGLNILHGLYLAKFILLLVVKHIQILVFGLAEHSGNRFRTFVTAKNLGLTGLVTEDPEKLIIEAEGEEEELDKLITYFERIHAGIPSIKTEIIEKPVMYYEEFLIQ